MKKSLLVSVLAAFFVPFLLGSHCGGGPTQAKTKIAITSPAAHQKTVAGDTLLISWTQSVANAKVSYNYNQGAGWQEFASVTKVDNNSVQAVLPVTSYTDSFQIKVEDNAGTYDAGVSEPFGIKYILITSPTAGQTLTNGSTVTITWKDTPQKLSSLRLMLSVDGGMTFGDMLAGSVSVDQTSSTWVIGSEPGSGGPFAYPSSSCILKIRDYQDDHLFDVTGTFSVQ